MNSINHTRQILIKICVVLNGDLVLMKKNTDWELPKTYLQSDENSMAAIKRILTDDYEFNTQEILENYDINHESLTNPWSVSTQNNQITLSYGLCYSSEEITNVSNTTKWIPLEDANRININSQDTNTIKSYITHANEDLEILRVKKYLKSIS